MYESPSAPYPASRADVGLAFGTGLLLLAVLTPSILSARDRARASVCKSNLKMIGLACWNYADTFRVFPPGVVVKDLDSATGGGIGWQVMILPFMDQKPLFDAMSFDTGPHFGTDAPADPLQTSIAAYRCPDDVSPQLNPWRVGRDTARWATSNYSGNSGHRPLNAGLPDGLRGYWPGVAAPTAEALQRRTPSPRTAAFRQSTDRGEPENLRYNGIFGINSSVDQGHIKDGTSNTFLVGERSILGQSGLWGGIRSPANINDAMTDTSHASRLGTPGGFSSLHGAANFAFCDGTVRAVASQIESNPHSTTNAGMGLYQRLGCRNDGLVVAEF